MNKKAKPKNAEVIKTKNAVIPSSKTYNGTAGNPSAKVSRVRMD